jgi:hypothetical protein
VSFSKSQIVAEIKRAAQANGGAPLGKRRFETETGIRESDWSGRYWARWTDAVAEAGYTPNKRTAAWDRDELLRPLAILARKIGRFPTRAEMRLANRTSSFPDSGLAHVFGARAPQIDALMDFCQREPTYADVLPLLDAPKSKAVGDAEKAASHDEPIGHVYLLRSGRYYKVGRSNAVGRRERELQIQLPERASVVHSIKTDDPVGIERYWHERFSERRKNGEFFQLTAEDIRAFRRRKFM